MKRISITIILLMFSIGCDRAITYEATCIVACTLNVEDNPVCGANCPDGFIYYWFPQGRTKLN